MSASQPCAPIQVVECPATYVPSGVTPARRSGTVGNLGYDPPIFEIPEYHELMDALGVGPEHLGEGVLRLDFRIADEELGVTLD